MVLLTVKFTTQHKYFFKNPKCITEYDIREPTSTKTYLTEWVFWFLKKQAGMNTSLRQIVTLQNTYRSLVGPIL